ncbi:hypothetical protein [Pedobacter ureilyticus]|uniref:DUF4025 domain-containing protein n=1 Tax=Pedobacter ureilyticus TaxID=1393051 RepID=A0ABW9JA96_9SPHI|nr:hypothetical protein [Pedobacter helvus]
MKDQNQKKEKEQSIDIEKQTYVPKAGKYSTEKSTEEDTSKEIISTHDDSSQDEGVDEQYGGDAADNRDE